MKLAVLASTLLLMSASSSFAQVAVATPDYPGLQPAGPPPGKGAHSGTEHALRHQIEALQAGQADYDAMTALMAAQARYQNDKVVPQVRQWGSLVSLKFRTADGVSDVYDATFEHARVEWKISPLGSNGKISNFGFKAL